MQTTFFNTKIQSQMLKQKLDKTEKKRTKSKKEKKEKNGENMEKGLKRKQKMK